LFVAEPERELLPPQFAIEHTMPQPAAVANATRKMVRMVVPPWLTVHAGRGQRKRSSLAVVRTHTPVSAVYFQTTSNFFSATIQYFVNK
jgi:hypothetical protein